MIRPKATELRCKVCRSPERAAIDTLLGLRSESKVLPDGTRVNLEYVLKRCAELGIENPTKENVATHFRRHCEYIKDSDAAEQEERVQETAAKLLSGELQFADLDESLRWLFTVYIEEQREKVKRGENLRLTHDQAMKIAGEMTKRKQNDAQESLMEALGQGIGLAFGALAEAVHPAIDGGVVEAEYKELPAGPVESSTDDGVE